LEFPKYKKNIYGVSRLIAGLGMQVSNPLFVGTPKIDIKLANQARVLIDGSFIEFEHLSNGGMQKERVCYNCDEK